MKTIYKSILPCALVVFLLALFGCTKDVSDILAVGTGKYSRNLVLNVMQPITRAEASEEQISRLDVLLFKDGVFETSFRNITSFDEVEGKAAVSLWVETEGVRDVYTLANLKNEKWLDGFVPGVTPVEELLRVETEELLEMASPPLVMCGISKGVNFGEFAQNTPCELYRIVARIDVKNNAANFRITSARLINSRATSVLFEGAVASSEAVANFDAVAAENGQVRLYTYENHSVDPSTATTLEITGEADGKLLTYQVDFKVDATQVPIHRNFLYTVNVTNVAQASAEVAITIKKWLVGADIDHVIDGDIPVTSFVMDSSVGSVNMADSTLNIVAKGGEFTLKVQANAECGVTVEGDWIQIGSVTRAKSFIEGEFEVSILPSSETTERTGKITLFNKLNPDLKNVFTVKQELGDDGQDKFLVIAVAGQSNAVGYDESVVFPDGKDAPSDRAFQLSYRTNGNLQIVPLTWCADDIQDKSRFKNVSGYFGLKGIHLPLAKELASRIPENYKLLFVNVAFTSSSLISPQNESMQYDQQLLRPAVMNATLRWGVGRPYNRTLADRVKYALDLHPDNKFIGVVWCQGESDSHLCDEHYDGFTAMTEEFFDTLNKDGYGARCPKGVADKDLWYNFSSVKFWMDWYDNPSSGALFGSYKQWNPNTFIHIPETDDNNVGGNGVSGQGRYHFGNGAYDKVIAPLVAECIDENGGLFNGKSPRGNRFNNNITTEYAAAYGGNFNDSDVQQSLVLYMPFTSSETEKVVGKQGIMRSGVSMVDVEGLTDINGNPRSRKAAAFDKASKIVVANNPVANSYTIAFMLRRTGSFGDNIQTVLGNGGNTSTPFLGFRSYAVNKRNAHMCEFMCEPLYTGQHLKAVPGQLFAADNVSSLTQWTHYVISYNHTTKLCIVYMNGQEVESAKISNTTALSLARFTIGYNSASFPGFEGELAELYIWNTMLAPVTVSKVFLMSYYGYTK